MTDLIGNRNPSERKRPMRAWHDTTCHLDAVASQRRGTQTLLPGGRARRNQGKVARERAEERVKRGARTTALFWLGSESRACDRITIVDIFSNGNEHVALF